MKQRHQQVGTKGGFRNMMKGAVLRHSAKHTGVNKVEPIDLFPPDKRNA